MKSKKLTFGVIAVFLLLGVFGYTTMQFKDAYAMKDGEFEGFTGLYIPEGATAAPGDKVNVELNFDSNMWDYVSVHFISTTSSDNFTVYLKNIDSGDANDPAYFILPESGNTYSSNPDGVKVGETYELKDVCLFNSEKSQCYTTDKNAKDEPFMDVGTKKYVNARDKQTIDEVNNFSLNQIKFKTTDAKIGDKVYFDINYTGVKPQFMSVWLKSEYGNTLYYPVEDIDTNPYIVLDYYDLGGYGSVFSGDYYISGITIGLEYDMIYYVNSLVNNKDEYSDYWWKWINNNEKIKVTGDSNSSVNDINNFADVISLSTQQAKINDKVNVELKNENSSAKIENALLLFEGVGFNSSINAYVKSIDSNPYIIVPFNAQNGDYALKTVIMKYSDGTKKFYRLGSEDASTKLTYIVLQVKNDSKTMIDRDKAYLDNLDYNSRMLAAMDEMTEDAIITVNASSNPFIDKGLFETIRETRKTLIIEYFDSEWVFSGTDIVNPKSIDVSIGYEAITDKNINNSTMLNDLDKQSLMLTFTNNGDLPGKALIRLKANQVDEMFSGDNLFVYFYNEQGSLDPVAMEIQKDNGYYDFYIDHNSKYILTNKKLSGNYVTSNDKYLKLNEKNTNKTNNSGDNKELLIIAGLVIALLVVIIIVLLSTKKNK
ncbi:MAG: hypothetical protein VZS44_04125 [Bacilli bacterium]|nr:hypothetical protein [Bacilli bacterium]